MRITFAQCFKAKARIVPIATSTFTTKASIKNVKSNNVPITFDVLGVNRQSRCRLQFIVATGYTRSKGLDMRVYIAKKLESRMTGHFLVAMTPSGPLKPVWNANVSTKQGIQLRAWISK
jgi:hypothetical protein